LVPHFQFRRCQRNKSNSPDFKQNSKYKNMKNFFVPLLIASALTISFVIVRQKAQAQYTGSEPTDKIGALMTDSALAETNNQEGSPIYGVTIPAGYRDWKLIAVDHLLVTGKADQLRAQLGNDIAIKAFKDGKLPFPDGAIIAAIHWTRIPSEDNNKVLAGPFPSAQSFVVGSPENVQFLVKDSKKYAATGDWGVR
jgi:hypothetical protein